ncbi:Tn3 family transposase [Yersinia pseudotuberculosis]|uniref:Tn3 family transposase n=1 Tax=Yersinia pseudotuberculosis TaxID=633 RepID=UPI0005AD3350|nr:Tn3 family transposase [Yersinia pseudotuberculosis]AJK18554.1 tn3 transposase DDE domain protein [Yersinia pseudotuberculosis str. PA3606]MCE4114808.1 Tn3 family transposase [Yersinia pseudotuberculosis]MCF1165417.1 Tn3 family transposase [Yersinia pseudotuberculosis]RYC18323.1 Tn3 family transposase [Yersinia pseudotuberculosis]UFA63895.1 Tn3 family transposase [Yersinia pseudotuberculosis]
MPVDFLTTEQEQNYGCYVAEPNDVQLVRYFHLDERDLSFIYQRRGKHNRLGIVLQLTTARFPGTFITDLTQVLPGVQHFVAVQLNIRRPEVLSRYAERDTTRREHTAQIKEYYGYHEFGDFPWSFRLKRLLYTRAWLSNERPGLMFDFATEWLLQNKILLSGATTLVRLVSEIRERANQRLWKKLAAIHYLTELNGSKKRILDYAPEHIITGPWKRLVYDAEGRIQRAGYSLCLLERLQDALRRRDIWLKNSDRWGDPREKLLQGEEWQAQRVLVCRALGHPTDGHKGVQQLAVQLDETWRAVASRFEGNTEVHICNDGKYPSLTISSLEKLEEPLSLLRLNNRVRQLLPPVDLTELLLEIDARTGFTREFTHVSESGARAQDLHISLCAVLMAEACNIGLEPLIKHNIPALTRHRLSWMKQNYLQAETLVSANARLVDFQSTLELARRWGGGEVASVDGMRFVTPVKTVNSGPNRKYFGSGRGITWYNFVSDQYSGFHGIVVPGTLRDSIFVLEGLLEQQTGLNPVEIMTDTAGTSDIIFGLFWLLGYQFSPRLADAGEAVFWRVDKSANYGALDELARGCADLSKAENQWDEMMRTAGSLKLGTIHASELIRSLLKSSRPSGLAQAIMAVGRVNKTLYLLNYIDDEDYRRRILTQLNRGESRHAVARAICYGQRGEIRKRYREGQEDQLGALGLVTNAVVLWNTLYMQEALSWMRSNGEETRDEDIARLSPLMHGHINMLGHYTFTLSDDILELRALNFNLNNELSP